MAGQITTALLISLTASSGAGQSCAAITLQQVQRIGMIGLLGQYLAVKRLSLREEPAGLVVLNSRIEDACSSRDFLHRDILFAAGAFQPGVGDEGPVACNR